MTQFINIDMYIEIVKSAGIEAAYAQRFRRTGKTTRAALRAAADVSGGRHLIISDSYPHWQQKAFVDRVAKYLCDVELSHTDDGLEVPCSGGLLMLSRGCRPGSKHPFDDFMVLTEI